MKRAFLAVLCGAAVLIPSGVAEAKPKPPPPAPAPVYDSDTVTVTTATDPGVSGATATAAATAATVYCKTVTVSHRHGSGIFNTTVYIWHIWTTWCYNYGSIQSASTGQYVDNLASTTDWQGVIGKTVYYTLYNQTFHHDEQAKWCANAPLYGCISYGYPKIILEVNKDGSYSWWVYGNE